MTTAQPGQEQRMECVECGGKSMANSQFCSQVCFERSTIKQTRPTADLGEDGELVEELLFAVRELNEVPAAEKREVESLTGLSFGAIADYTQRAADRLILYREALVAARPYVEANASRNSRMTAHHKGADVLDMIDAVLSRSGGWAPVFGR